MGFAIAAIGAAVFLALTGYLYDLYYLGTHLHSQFNLAVTLSLIGVLPSFGPFIGWFLIFFG